MRKYYTKGLEIAMDLIDDEGPGIPEHAVIEIYGANQALEIIWETKDSSQPVRVLMRDGAPVVQIRRTSMLAGRVSWEDSKDPAIIKWALAEAAKEKMGLNELKFAEGTLRHNPDRNLYQVFHDEQWYDL